MICPDTRSIGASHPTIVAVVVFVVGASFESRSPAVTAGPCRILQYSFEPDCFVRNAAGSCTFDRSHPDLGPQVAVWIEDANQVVIDTLMVTNAVALYGIGNRPGRWDFRSGPRFPYGPRPMVLPVWAHRRGKVFDAVTMNDGLDNKLTSHEGSSSPEPYFCRPMLLSEVVDAVTCATGFFNSAKGVLSPSLPKSYYPPRGDLFEWGDPCVPRISRVGNLCDYGDAAKFAVLNDLDVVATPTPAYDQRYDGKWQIPIDLPDGDYALLVEVSKEFDENDTFHHVSYLDPSEVEYYSDYGMDGNIGQPSIVYRLPFSFARDSPIGASSVIAATGAGDWTGATGALQAIDDSISNTPGSGQGRLRLTAGPDGSGRLHIVEGSCAAVDCSVAPVPEAPRISPTPTATSDSIAITFRQSSDSGSPVIKYDLRFTPAPLDRSNPFAPLDKTSFLRWAAAPTPAPTAPGELTKADLDRLNPGTTYAIGLRAEGACGWSQTTFVRASTGVPKYQQLSGCVIATAAYGSDLDPGVVLLRGQRDLLASRYGLVRMAALLYGDTAPPLAAVIRNSAVARAFVRSLIRPLITIDELVSDRHD